MATPDRPVPRPTPVTTPFWAACRERRLTFQRCRDCGHIVFIPQSFCSACLGTTLDWEESQGRGTVVSYTVAWRAPTPAFTVPYTIATVGLTEGYEMMTNIVQCPVEDVQIGMPVVVTFCDVTDDVTLPFFRPAADEAAP